MKRVKSFILHLDTLEVVEELTDEQAGKLLRAMIAFNKNGELMELEPSLKLVFSFFKNQFIRDHEKWEEIKHKRSKAGKWNRKKTLKNENETGG